MTHVFLGRVSEKTRRNAALAANAAGDVFVLRERGLPPHIMHSKARVLALRHYNKQVRHESVICVMLIHLSCMRHRART